MESDMRYAVIKFPQDNTVDVVPSNWLETTNEGIYCYWPRKNFTAKVKRRDVPDPAMWSKHLASVLVYAENYEEARLKSNQATVTSNLESDEEPSRRPVRRPARYRRPLEDSDEEDMPAPKMSRTVNTSRFTPRREFFGERMAKKSIPETLPRNTFSEPCSSGLLIRQEPESDRELLFEEACQKIHPKVPAKVLEDCIADTLKYAPHRESRMEHEQQTD
ncbi:uncharacterized protein [Misgurnus anguillicaudatus]|uniref:uncharacterized protein isoform X2 n=1 Tax=Misgurnus anguillicaudatus TaxID=75329 RepID=UPI003CCF8A23